MIPSACRGHHKFVSIICITQVRNPAVRQPPRRRAAFHSRLDVLVVANLLLGRKGWSRWNVQARHHRGCGAAPWRGLMRLYARAKKHFACAGVVLLIFVGVRTPLNMTAIVESMPRLTQKGPSCGSTCLAMSLEFLGLPCDPDIIERRIHPYGDVDLGELPAGLAKFARHVGFVAQHYNFGALEQLQQYRAMGYAVIVMLNYNGGTGHLVNLLGFDADEEGITGVRIRNPWGFDETIPVDRFLNEWRHLRQSRSSTVGYMLPVFDAGYAVVASSGGLPATPIVDWLHSAPVDVLIASLNGLGGSITTMPRHWLPGLSQFFGNFLGVLGGAAAYAVGNLIGLNILFVGDDWLLSKKNSLVGCMLVAVGWSFSVAGGLLAAAVWLLQQPMISLGERCAGRDALCEAIFGASSQSLRSALARAGAEQLACQIHLLRSGHGVAECRAASRLLELAPGSPDRLESSCEGARVDGWRGENGSNLSQGIPGERACASWREINRGRIGQEVEGWPCSAAAKRQSGHPKVPNQELRKVLGKSGIGSSSSAGGRCQDSPEGDLEWRLARQADNAQLFAGLGLFFLVVHIFFMRPRQALRTAVTATPPDPTDHLKNVLPGVLEQNAARDAE
eukprot:s367_g9.t2